MDLVIKGGTVISPWGRQKLDIMVDKGKIVALGDVGAAKADRVIDATGKMVIPGGIECHTHHENAFQGAVGGDDFYGGSVAAACGGTTTMMDFSITLKGNMPLDFLKKRISMAEERGIVLDFSFHCCLTEINPEILAQIKDVIDYGAASFKVYMIYRKEEMMLDDGQLMALMDVATKHGGLVGVHAENAAIAEYRTDLLLKNGRTRWTDHPVAKPNIVEAEAIQRAALLAKEMGTGMYIYHMSTKEGVDYIKELTGASCSIYLNNRCVSTTVIGGDCDARAVNRPIPTEARSKVFETGQNYLGQAVEEGRFCSAVYKPIINDEGQIIGVLYIGTQDTLYESIIYGSPITIGIAGLILAVLIALTARFLVTRKLDKILPTEISRLPKQEQAHDNNDKDVDFEMFDAVFDLEQELPKGLNSLTLKEIFSVLLEDGGKEVTVKDVSESMSLSTVTVRRYLDYMEECGLVDVEQEYGAVGRPLKIYRLKH
jgi:methyl-accepting chemotaxis protein